MCLQQAQRRSFPQLAVLPGDVSCLLLVFVLEAPAAERQEVVLALYGSRPDLPANIIVERACRSRVDRSSQQ